MQVVPIQVCRKTWQCWGQVDSLWNTRPDPMSLVPRNKKDPCHCPTVHCHNRSVKPFCLQHTAASLWYWAYLTIYRESSHYTGNQIVIYTTCIYSGNSWQWKREKCWRAQSHCRSIELSGQTEVTFHIIIHLNRADLDRCTAMPNYIYDLVVWQEKHPVGNSEENPSYLIWVRNFNSWGYEPRCLLILSLPVSPREILLITHKK